MKLKPINDNILIELPKKEDVLKSQGGLVISQNNSQEKPDKATVVSCGEGRLTLSGDVIPLKVLPGDEIIFNKFSGTEITANNKRYLIIKENDILAKIEK